MSEYGAVLTCAHEFRSLEGQNVHIVSLFDTCWMQTGADIYSYFLSRLSQT